MRRRFLKSQTPLSYMTIEALEYTTVVLPGKIEYSFNDDNTWEEGEFGRMLYLQKGATVSFRNMEQRTRYSYSFTIRGSCNLEGNCMSLIPDGKLYKYAFYELFKDCDGIISVSEDFLPATTLADRCYSYMFYGCTNLTTAPELPATTLAYYCYQYMFYGCTSLVNAPELPATTLASYCYSYMFYGCSKLNYIKMLATDISASKCLYNWVNGVASTGTFVKNPEATWDVVGVNGVPEGWTVKFDGEEDEKTINKGIITVSRNKYTITFDYPVASDIKVVFDSGAVTIYAGSISGSLNVMPGEDPVLEGFAPSEDDTYIYEIVQ